jgi:hypothetical protein
MFGVVLMSMGSNESFIIPMSKVEDDDEDICGLALSGE